MIRRRDFLAATSVAALLGSTTTSRLAHGAASVVPNRATPFPLANVRLLPSLFSNAVEVNQRYVLSLEPDRLLHYFRGGAGLPPRAEAYGGWERETIAGHTLGHYLSALALLHTQTGNAACCERAAYVVAELAQIQVKRGNGYVAALMRKRKDGTIVDGEEIFGEITRGDISATNFDLNGAWSPLYTIHKLFAGLLDVHALCANTQALDVARGLAGYLGRVIEALDDAALQKMLACEYGGLNESFAELYARTDEARWLSLAKRLYDQRVLDALAQRQDELANKHSNTQVPKLVGLARLHELTGDESQATAARFFWERVTKHHSYVIGGNSDREYFFAPDAISKHITEQTCEHCNSYNMLKLTRHLFGWQPHAAWFDFYERTHLNHVMSQQHPDSGMFTYMTPLMSGAVREFSTATDSFWCCVGSGMESHAKHGDSIYWEGDDTLFVNLYIPSTARWPKHNAQLRLTSGHPLVGNAQLRLDALPRRTRFAIALRVPSWAASAELLLNDQKVVSTREAGYAVVTRRWKEGDVLSIAWPQSLRTEATPDDPDTIALLHGPLVLAADLGAGPSELTRQPPALVGDDVIAGFSAVANSPGTYQVGAHVARPSALTFVPFFRQYERRSAVYFKRYTDAGWRDAEAKHAAEQRRQQDIAARAIDIVKLGEEASEREHRLASQISYPLSYRGRSGRDARSGGFFEFDLATGSATQLLVTYWGGEMRREFDILIDGQPLARQVLDQDLPGTFFDVTYAIPAALVRDKPTVRLRFEPQPKNTVGPVFGVKALRG